ncbi:MAG TPA: serine/threonine-protein kinase [Gemmatimonadaceae bacterium]
MPQPELIATKAQTTPRSLGGSRRRERAIPNDLLKMASRRLEIMSLLATAIWTVASIAWHLQLGSASGHLGFAGYQLSDTIAVVAVIASLAMFFYARNNKDPKYIPNIGLGYMVVTATAIGLITHWYIDPNIAPPPIVPTISWVGVVILMFAAVIPINARKTIIAGIIAASMNPIGMLIARERGVWHFSSWVDVLVMHWPDYALIGVAVVIARVVTRLGKEVSKAREMGSYKLGDLIKRGGMGEVYRATHTMLARPAAIKFIRPEMLGGENGDDAQIAIKRFYREAEAAANLRSPHTVELFDFGVTEDNTLYFVMELLQGMDLESMVQKYGPLPAARVIHILCQACESLEEAHVRGLVHRDIKPANIHVGRVGIHDDFVKVLDFGLVKSVTAGSEVSLDAIDFGLVASVATSREVFPDTAVGRTPGTPEYMAPEMALGETVDARSDIYALGCVAYYLLTGKLVFDADSHLQMVARHVHREALAPSARGGIEIPQELDRIVLSCLAKNPDARPATAADLSRALRALDVQPWSEAQARDWWAQINETPQASPAVSYR